MEFKVKEAIEFLFLLAVIAAALFASIWMRQKVQNQIPVMAPNNAPSASQATNVMAVYPYPAFLTWDGGALPSGPPSAGSTGVMSASFPATGIPGLAFSQ
jgi:hypothetical protein